MLVYRSDQSEAISGYMPEEGYTVCWYKDDEGNIDRTILMQNFSGPFLWSDWLKNEIKIKKMLDDTEDEYRALDRKTGRYNKVNFVVDLVNINFTMVKPLSLLPQVSNSQHFIHPRAGDVIVVGISRSYRSFSVAMLKVIFDIFIKAFPMLAPRLIKVDTVEEALALLKYRR